MTLLRHLFRLISKIFAFIIGFFTLYVCLPVIIILLGPILIYRYVLHKISNLILPDLGKMVTARGTIAALNDIYKSPRAKLAIGLVLEGCPSYEDLHQGIKSTIEFCDWKSKARYYPELTQSIVQWMGFLFWKPVDNFLIDDYIRVENSNVKYNFDQAFEMMNQEALIPFEEGKALWKIILLPNFVPNESQVTYFRTEKQYSFAIITIHHSLADGFSIIKLMYSLFQVSNPQERILKAGANKSFWRKLFWPFLIAFKMPYDLGMTALASNMMTKVWKQKPRNNENSSSSSDNKLEYFPIISTEKFVVSTSELIPFSIIRDAGKRYGASSLAVISASLTGAVRNVMFDNPKDVPSKVNFIIPYPLNDRPNKLRNNLSGGMLTLPIGEPEELKRLRNVNSSLKKLKQSTIPLFADWSGRLIGSLFPGMIKLTGILLKSENAVFLTSLPGPKEELKMFKDITCKEAVWTNSGAIGSKVLGFSFSTYAGFGRLTVTSDFALMEDRTKADKIIKEFVDQLDSLNVDKIAQQEVV